MRRIAIVAVLVLAVMTGGWYEGLYHSETAKIKTLDSSQQLAQDQVLQLQAEYSGMVADEKRVAQERAGLVKLERLLPEGPSEDLLYKDLFQAVKKAGCTVVDASVPVPAPAPSAPPPTVAPTSTTTSTTSATTATTAPAPVPVAAPAELTITLQVSGTAAHVQKLYQELNAEPRLFVVDNSVLGLGALGINRAHNPPGIETATLSVRAFYSNAGDVSAAS